MVSVVGVKKNGLESFVDSGFFVALVSVEYCVDVYGVVVYVVDGSVIESLVLGLWSCIRIMSRVMITRVSGMIFSRRITV